MCNSAAAAAAASPRLVPKCFFALFYTHFGNHGLFLSCGRENKPWSAEKRRDHPGFVFLKDFFFNVGAKVVMIDYPENNLAKYIAKFGYILDMKVDFF